MTHDLNPNKVNAIVDDHAFKTTAMLLFKKTMLLLTNIANENPELLKNIPEFLCQNINDVTGLLRLVTNVWHNFWHSSCLSEISGKKIMAISEFSCRNF